MAWVVNFGGKVANFLDIEDVFAMHIHEGTYDFVGNQLQKVGNSIRYQYQTMSANIGNQFHAIHANINQFCSTYDLDEKDSELVDVEINNIQQTPLTSFVSSPDSPDTDDSELADAEDENIKLTVPESTTNSIKINFGSGLEKSTTTFLDDSDSIDSISSIASSDIASETESDSSIIGCERDFNPAFDAYSFGNLTGVKFGQFSALVDINELQSSSLSTNKSHSGKNITCEACAISKKLTDHQECQHQLAVDEALNGKLNQLEDEISVPPTTNSENASLYFCEADWVIV